MSFRPIAILSAVAGMAACSPTVPAYLAHPADAGMTVRPAGYSSVTAGAPTFRPVEPKGWEELNKRADPKTGSSHAK